MHISPKIYFNFRLGRSLFQDKLFLWRIFVCGSQVCGLPSGYPAPAQPTKRLFSSNANCCSQHFWQLCSSQVTIRTLARRSGPQVYRLDRLPIISVSSSSLSRRSKSKDWSPNLSFVLAMSNCTFAIIICKKLPKYISPVWQAKGNQKLTQLGPSPNTLAVDS